MTESSDEKEFVTSEEKGQLPRNVTRGKGESSCIGDFDQHQRRQSIPAKIWKKDRPVRGAHARKIRVLGGKRRNLLPGIAKRPKEGKGLQRGGKAMSKESCLARRKRVGLRSKRKKEEGLNNTL